MNCKQGDLATIIKSVDGINVGKVVQVGQYMGEHSKLGPIWHIFSKGCDLITEYGAVGPGCDCPDAWLRPLPPDDMPAANDAKYELEVVA